VDLELHVPETSALPRAEDQIWWPRFGQSSPGVEVRPDDTAVTSSNAPDIAPSNSLKPRYFAPNLEVQTLSKAALLAFLAGLILNFMPCVLPVITLKLRSFIPAAGSVPQHQRQAFRSHNLFSLSA